MRWLELLMESVLIVAKMVGEKASDEEIADRLRAPGSVGALLLDGAERRKARRKEYEGGGQ